MTIQEAMQVAFEKDQWFRPFSMRGTGYAFCTEGTSVKFVPTMKGGAPARFPDVDDICGEWEVVSPDVVNTELP